jgi:ComF family protein
LNAVLTVLLAPACASCDQLLDRPTRGPVCPACWHSILPLTAPLCDRCGDPLSTWRRQGPPASICTRCRRVQSVISRGRAVGSYEGALRAILHAFKYGGRRSLARPLAALMRERGAEVLAGAAFAVPVPLHRRRRRQRGFNQATDLANGLGLRVVHGLARARSTAAQASLPAARRHANVRDAFVVRRAVRRLRGEIVVLVDDVSTTGATLEACARALEAAGVGEIRVLTAARVVSMRLD